MTTLAGLTWPEAGERSGSVLVVPVGAVEQHGPHLPLDTDIRIAVAVAEGLVALRPDLVVAPPAAYGSSGEHADFPGTISIGRDVVERLLVELVRSANAWHGVVLVSAHGGNAVPLRRAEQVLLGEGRRVLVWSVSVPGGDAHAGRTETSLMLAIAPEAVHLERAESGNTQDLCTVIDDIQKKGLRSVSHNGVLGDPSGAAVEEGRRLLAALVSDLDGAVDAWLG